MLINYEALDRFSMILDRQIVYESSIISFINTKPIRSFIEHENSFHRYLNREKLLKTIKEMKVYNKIDEYGFYKLNNNKKTYKESLKYIKLNENEILNKSIEKVYSIVPKHILMEYNINFYLGGNDGGFTINRKDIYINYLQYYENMEELIKVLSHEIFHCRPNVQQNKFKDIFNKNIDEVYLFQVLGRILEEGLATFIQHGEKLLIDDPVNTLTKEKLKDIDLKFYELNNILLGLKSRNTRLLKDKFIDVYPLGYHIICRLHKYDKIESSFSWIERYQYKETIKAYITISRENKIPSGFTEEIETWLLNM